MKRLIEENENDGLLSLMGKRVTFWCVNYIYTGKLIGVNDVEVRLTDAAVVYETGPLTEPNWKDAEPLPHDQFIRLSAVESYGELK